MGGGGDRSRGSPKRRSPNPLPCLIVLPASRIHPPRHRHGLGAGVPLVAEAALELKRGTLPSPGPMFSDEQVDGDVFLFVMDQFLSTAALGGGLVLRLPLETAVLEEPVHVAILGILTLLVQGDEEDVASGVAENDMPRVPVPHAELHAKELGDFGAMEFLAYLQVQRIDDRTHPCHSPSPGIGRQVPVVGMPGPQDDTPAGSLLHGAHEVLMCSLFLCAFQNHGLPNKCIGTPFIGPLEEEQISIADGVISSMHQVSLGVSEEVPCRIELAISLADSTELIRVGASLVEGSARNRQIWEEGNGNGLPSLSVGASGGLSHG